MNDTSEVLSYYFLILKPKGKRYQSVFTLIPMIFFISIALTSKASATEPSAISATSAESSTTQLTSADAQKLWNRSCFTCHGDSEDIARKFLSVVDGELQGPMHKASFRTFLTNHYLSKTKADAIYSLLLTQATTKSRFDQECSSCHQKMDDLIRENLALHNGILYSKELKTPTYGFLETHRELSKDDVKYFIKKLTFRGYEIFVPVKME